MGRALLIAEFFIQTKNEDKPKLYPIYIATSHFESLNADAFIENRRSQLFDTFGAIFKKEPNAIVVGDFNFDDLNE